MHMFRNRIGLALLLMLQVVSEASLAGSGIDSIPDGVFWRVSGNGLKAPSYILGTVHSLHKDAVRHVPMLEQYLDSVESFVLESDYTKQRAECKKSNPISPEQIKRLDEHFRRKGRRNPYKRYLSQEQMDSLDAWINYLGDNQSASDNPDGLMTSYRQMNPIVLIGLASYYSGLKREAAYERLGYETTYRGKPFDWELENYYIDKNEALKARHGADTIRIVELDSLSLSIHSTMPFPDFSNQIPPDSTMTRIVYNLVQYLKRRTEQIEVIDSLYRDGKGYALLQFLNGNDEATDILRIDERNRAWMRKIPTIIGHGPSLIVVGLGHLLPSSASEGLLFSLMAQGYSVSPVYK